MANGEKKVSVAEFLSQKIPEVERTQREIAQACGWSHPNVISMLKNGSMKLPLGRVPAVAYAIGVSPSELMRIALEEYLPGTLAAIEQSMDGLFLTEHEREVVRAYREIAGPEFDIIVGRAQWLAIIDRVGKHKNS